MKLKLSSVRAGVKIVVPAGSRGFGFVTFAEDDRGRLT
jgi:hypothetical protein